MRLALLAALLLAGCTSTRYVDATSPAEIAAASVAVVGRDAEITLTSGDRYRGTVQFLRPDSTAWEDIDAFYAVPTADVRALVVDTRRRRLTRGALIGGGTAFALCFIAGTTLGDEFGGDGGQNASVGILFGAACIPGGAFYGLIGGAVASSRTEVILYDPADEPAGAEASEPPD